MFNLWSPFQEEQLPAEAHEETRTIKYHDFACEEIETEHEH